MKIILMATFIIFFTVQSFAQISISNSQWKIHTNTARPVDIVFDFKNDPLFIIGESDNKQELMKFSQHGDSLYFYKIAGGSSCARLLVVYWMPKLQYEKQLK